METATEEDRRAAHDAHDVNGTEATRHHEGSAHDIKALWNVFGKYSVKGASSRLGQLTHITGTQFMELMATVRHCEDQNPTDPQRLRLVLARHCRGGKLKHGRRTFKVPTGSMTFDAFLEVLVHSSRLMYPSIVQSRGENVALEALKSRLIERAETFAWLPRGLSIDEALRFCVDEAVQGLLQGSIARPLEQLFQQFCHGDPRKTCSGGMLHQEWLQCAEELLYLHKESPNILSRQQLGVLFVLSCRTPEQYAAPQLAFDDFCHALALVAFCMVKRQIQVRQDSHSYSANLQTSFEQTHGLSIENALEGEAAVRAAKSMLHRIARCPRARAAHHSLMPFVRAFSLMHVQDGKPRSYLSAAPARSRRPEVHAKEILRKVGLSRGRSSAVGREKKTRFTTRKDFTARKDHKQAADIPVETAGPVSETPTPNAATGAKLSITQLISLPQPEQCDLSPIARTAWWQTEEADSPIEPKLSVGSGISSGSSVRDRQPRRHLGMSSDERDSKGASKDQWVAFHDPATGNQYFYNTRSGETQWERPHEPGAVLST